jgi:hypothetical protein
MGRKRTKEEKKALRAPAIERRKALNAAGMSWDQIAELVSVGQRAAAIKIRPP